MTLIEALPATFEGSERIRRMSWPQGVAVTVHNAQLCINWADGQVSAQWHPLIIVEADYFADDWEVGDA